MISQSCFVLRVIVYGEKGAAKTTACEFLKSLVDPSRLETLTLEKDPRTLAVNLQQHWLLALDNVSHINGETSDTLCRAITGGGIQQRKLNTNAEDFIFRFQRNIVINGISNVATRPDLLDRAILLELERVPDMERREKREVLAAFEADRAAILGGIFDVLAKAMAIYPMVKLERLSRMADFTRWGFAIGEALGGLGQQFLNEYAANIESQNIEAINADPVATLVFVLMNRHNTWSGRVSDLLLELTKIAPEHGISLRLIPSQPNALSKRLNGMKSNLKAAGISFEKHIKDNGTHLILSRANLSPASPDHQKLNHINGLPHGDKLVVNGDATSLSPCPHPFHINKNGGTGGHGDKIPVF